MLRYLALPFRLPPLLLVGIFALLLRLAAHAGLLGLPLALILLSWFFKYAFLMLDHAAQGRPGAPVLTVEAANPIGEMRPLVYLAAVFALYALAAACGAVSGPIVADGVRLAGWLLLPAIVATHAITGSFFTALNPALVFEMVRRLGTGYALVVAVAIACALLGRWVAFDASATPLMLRLALLMLLWLVLFACLGGALYERRFEVGFEPEHSPEKAAARTQRERDRERDHFIDQLFHECRSGSVTNALASIHERIGSGRNAADELSWIHERVSDWQSPRLANRLAQELLPLLLATQRNGEALKVARARLRADRDFRPVNSEQVIKLAQLARAGGDLSLARGLLADFEQRFPDDPARSSAEQLARLLQR